MEPINNQPAKPINDWADKIALRYFLICSTVFLVSAVTGNWGFMSLLFILTLPLSFIDLKLTNPEMSHLPFLVIMQTILIWFFINWMFNQSPLYVLKRDYRTLIKNKFKGIINKIFANDYGNDKNKKA
jgi:energy-coupling factor transporter transmembrane protein EcfT